jgi:hypothetical protein
MSLRRHASRTYSNCVAIVKGHQPPFHGSNVTTGRRTEEVQSCGWSIA